MDLRGAVRTKLEEGRGDDTNSVILTRLAALGLLVGTAGARASNSWTISETSFKMSDNRVRAQDC